MSIPSYDKFFMPFMQCLSDKKEHKFKNIVDYCADSFNISEDERNILTKSGQKLLNNRIGWTAAYLKKAELVKNTSRGVLVLTDSGVVAVEGKKTIDTDFLMTFESFRKYVGKPKKVENNISTASMAQPVVSDLSPEEQMQEAYDELNNSLADDLMEEVMKMDCYQFEYFVIKLLISMGYGSVLDNENSTTPKSGDGGIDGILKADKFGFDSIYIQAKQWKQDSKVGSPEIQKFAGSMSLHGAQKGLFITTASFSNEAIRTAQSNPLYKIVLIDGEALTKFMIEYDVGVSTVETYKIKKVDTDFFNDFC